MTDQPRDPWSGRPDPEGRSPWTGSQAPWTGSPPSGGGSPQPPASGSEPSWTGGQGPWPAAANPRTGPAGPSWSPPGPAEAPPDWDQATTFASRAEFTGPGQYGPGPSGADPAGWSGSPPAPSGPAGRSSRWLIPLAIVAAALVIAASVGATTLAAGSPEQPPAVTTTAMATAVTSSVVSTVVSTTASTTSVAVVTPSVHACTDGSTGTGTCKPYECWDGTSVTDQRCPAVSGAKALQWVYPAHGTPARSCVAMTSTDLGGATEGVVCTWPDLTKIKTYLMRWPSPEAAKAYGDNNFGTSLPTAGSKGTSLGIEWDLTSVDHDKRWIYDVIPGQPYSFEMYYEGADGHKDPQITSWYDRQSYAYPAEIQEAQQAAG